VHCCAARCNNLHCSVSDALCKSLNEIGVPPCANTLHGDAHQFAVVNGCGKRVAATSWGKVGVYLNVNEERLWLLVLLWVHTMRCIKSHVPHADPVALTRAGRSVGTIRIRADGVVRIIPRRAEGSVNDSHSIAVLLHVMHAHHVDASKRPEGAGGHRRR